MRFGHSSDKRDHLRQVKLGQAAPEGGLALYHRTEGGARNETAPVVEAMEALRSALGRADFLLCGDSALVSERNLRALHEDGISFLAPLPADWGYRERYLAELSPEALAPLDYVSARQASLPEGEQTRYVGAELPWLLPLRDGQTVSLRALFVHSSEEETACRKSRARQLARAEEKLARVERGLGGRQYPNRQAVERELAQLLVATPGRFLRTEVGERADGKPTLRFWRDQEAIAEAECLDGLYCLITNVAAEDVGPSTLLAWLKEQERVERCHRALKGLLRVRPLFVQNDERIVALLVVCCFALMLYTLIEHEARPACPDGLAALGEGRRCPATARSALALLVDLELVHEPDGQELDGPVQARSLLERLTSNR